MTTRTAVLYARVSSREQREEGYSIEAQIRLLRTFAKKNGFEIAEEFVDIESAKSTGRKQFGNMVAFLRRSKTCRTILVEKTDRLSRNFEDEVLLDSLNLEIHFVKTGTVLSKDARAQTKFMHSIELVSSKFYSDNLSEEVIKGMREKAENGWYPGRAPFGYLNNRATRTLDKHPEKSALVVRVFEMYATGRYSLFSLSKELRHVTGTYISKANIHQMLNNPIYVGRFLWRGEMFEGKHETFISPELYVRAQAVLTGHNRPKYGKHELAFRGMLTCAHDDCAVTAELKKGKYVYYHCTGYRGPCLLPRFREEVIAERLGTCSGT
jgi:site-specific DNA recombinase